MKDHPMSADIAADTLDQMSRCLMYMHDLLRDFDKSFHCTDFKATAVGIEERLHDMLHAQWEECWEAIDNVRPSERAEIGGMARDMPRYFGPLRPCATNPATLIATGVEP